MAKPVKTTTKTVKPEKAEVAETKPVKLPKGGLNTVNVPIEAVTIKKGFNPRTTETDISALTSSIKKHGLLNPITVCPVKPGASKYYVVAGHSRFTAMTELGKAVIPAVIRDDIDISAPEAFALAMSENSDENRTPLSPGDQAAAFAKMLEALGGEGHEGEVAAACGYSRKTVERSLKFNAAPKAVKARVEDGSLSRFAALALIDAPESVQKKVLERIPTEGASERDVRTVVKEVQQEERKAAKASGKDEKSTAVKKTVDGKVSTKNLIFGGEPGVVCVSANATAHGDMRFKLAKLIYNLRVDLDESDKAGRPAIEAKLANASAALTALCWAAGISSDVANADGVIIDQEAVDRCVTKAEEIARAEAAEAETETEESGAQGDETEEPPKAKTAKKVKAKAKAKPAKKAKAKAEVDEDEVDEDEDAEADEEKSGAAADEE